MDITKVRISSPIPIPDLSESDIRRFWAKVDPKPKATGCLEWTAYKNNGGYGEIFIGKKLKANRVAYAIYHGKCPAELEVCHTCDNPACVAEAHLYAGTHKKNMRDKVDRGRCNAPSGSKHGQHTKPERTARGERNGAAKVKEWQVKMIRRMRQDGVPPKEIASLFNISASTVSKISTGRNWSSTLR